MKTHTGTEAWFLTHGLPYFVAEERAAARAGLRGRRLATLALVVVLLGAAVGVLAWATETSYAAGPALWLTVTGLAEGHWALVTKTHHAMVDGVGAVDASYLLFDGVADTTDMLLRQAQELLVPSEAGDSFQREYHRAVQESPEVAMMHGQWRRQLPAFFPDGGLTRASAAEQAPPAPVGLESQASVMRTLENSVVPGLLQTPGPPIAAPGPVPPLTTFSIRVVIVRAVRRETTLSPVFGDRRRMRGSMRLPPFAIAPYASTI